MGKFKAITPEDTKELSELKFDLSIILNENPSFIRFVKKSLATDDMWNFCIEKDPSIFRYKKRPSYPFCVKAVQLDGSNIQYVPNTRDYPMLCQELCEIAVKTSPAAILLIPQIYITKNLLHLACDEDPSLMLHFRLHDAYLITRVRSNPSIVKYINPLPDHLKKIVIHADPQCALSIPFDQWTKAMFAQLKEEWPDFAQSLSIDESKLPD